MITALFYAAAVLMMAGSFVFYFAFSAKGKSTKWLARWMFVSFTMMIVGAIGTFGGAIYLLFVPF